MNKHLVFVYGSLKQGFHNNRILSGAKFVGADKTQQDMFSMYSLGAYPAVTQGGTDYITGELYEVDDPTFERLDHLEGYPTFYDRIKIPTALHGGGVWMYVINNDKSLAYVNKKAKVEGGVWSRA